MDILTLLLPNRPHAPSIGARETDPAWLGRRMATLYRCWDSGGTLDLVALTAGFLDQLGLTNDPIGRVCLHVAKDVAHWGGHPYHSAQHHAEVATNAMVLTEVASRIGQPIPPHQRTILLAGSLAHDIGYELVPSSRAHFGAEAKSAATLDVINARYGVERADREALRCLILATEPSFRARLAKLLSQPGSLVDVPAPLHPLAAQPQLVELAAVLSDADLLSSAGLTVHWHRVQLDRLERELGHHIAPAEDLWFFEQIVGDDFLSPGGHHFLPNLVRIRQAVQSAAMPSGEERDYD